MQQILFFVTIFCTAAFTVHALEIIDAPQQLSSQISTTKAETAKQLEKPQNPAEDLIENDEEVFKKLLAEGLDVNSRDADGNTPLILVLKNNDNLNMARLLIEAGADVNAPDADGNTPLIIAVSVANELDDQQKILKAAQISHVSLIPEEQLRKRIKVQMEQAEQMLEMLLEHGADVNQETPMGTPLMAAVTNDKNIRMIEMLIEAGAKVNAQDQNGQTALFYAHAYNSVEAEALLLKAGADIELTDHRGRTYMDINPEK